MPLAPITPIRTFVQTSRQDHAARQARRRELDAFARAGERIAAHGALHTVGQTELMARIRPLQAQHAELTAAIERSRAKDRADYAIVGAWMRPVVVARGLCDRMVLRHLRHQERRRLRPLYEELGAMAGITTSALLTPPASPLMTAFTASPSPSSGAKVSTGIAREGWAFVIAFVKQAQSTLIPRAPALAGLAVGWWITRTYTDSRWRSVLHRVGIGDGGTKVVSSDTLQAMNFWLPLLAAAICAYLGDRIARWFRRRYAPPTA